MSDRVLGSFNLHDGVIRRIAQHGDQIEIETEAWIDSVPLDDPQRPGAFQQIFQPLHIKFVGVRRVEIVGDLMTWSELERSPRREMPHGRLSVEDYARVHRWRETIFSAQTDGDVFCIEGNFGTSIAITFASAQVDTATVAA